MIRSPSKPKYLACERPFRPVAGAAFQCGECAPCIARRVDDWTSRCIAESWGSDACWMVTLTIGGDTYYGSQRDNPKAQALFKADLIAFNKRLRRAVAYDAERAGVRCPTLRFAGVGELGPAKGRPHYHQIVFMQHGDKLPGAMPGERFFWGTQDVSVTTHGFPESDDRRTFWPWGHANVKPFDGPDAAYLAKYMLKTAEERRGAPAPWEIMAPIRPLRPLLGAGYLDELARLRVVGQLPLHDDGYVLPRRPDYTGPDARHYMRPRAKLYLADSYRRQWAERHAAEPKAFPPEPPWSELLEKIAEADALRVRRVWLEGEQYRQRFAAVLELRRQKAAAAIDKVITYARVKAGEYLWSPSDVVRFIPKG